MNNSPVRPNVSVRSAAGFKNRHFGDKLYPYDIRKLPLQLQKLPGLYAAYISGYSTESISPEGVTVLGEVAAVRADEGIGKGYVWVFGASGSGVYINGPYKYFDGHHFQDTGSVPVDKLFGNVPPCPSDD